MQQRAFAGSGVPYEGYHLPGCHFDVDAPQYLEVTELFGYIFPADHRLKPSSKLLKKDQCHPRFIGFGKLDILATFAENRRTPMFWTLELASYLEDAPWPATKDELIDYSIRSGAPIEVVENLQELEDEGDVFESIEDIWPDYPTQDDFLFNEDEY